MPFFLSDTYKEIYDKSAAAMEKDRTLGPTGPDDLAKGAAEDKKKTKGAAKMYK
jgi:hypothetical protein